MPNFTSFDRRIVRYEEIHSIQPDDFRALVAASEILGTCKILDCGCGYGAVTREILLATDVIRAKANAQLTIDLIDESGVQLERAKKELSVWLNAPGVKLRFTEGAFPTALGYHFAQYDVVACKMVLHEIRRDQQPSFLEEIHQCLKAGGRFVLWDVCLSSEIATFYRQVVKSKDALAGYETMVQRRNFLTEAEIEYLFRASPFGGIDIVRNITYRFETQKRFIAEFDRNEVRFAQWQEFIRVSALALDPSVLAAIHYRDQGTSISFDVRKVIAVARRSDNLI